MPDLPEVPADAVEAGRQAAWGYLTPLGFADDVVNGEVLSLTHDILAAALPHIEADVRARVADEERQRILAFLADTELAYTGPRTAPAADTFALCRDALIQLARGEADR